MNEKKQSALLVAIADMAFSAARIGELPGHPLWLHGGGGGVPIPAVGHTPEVTEMRANVVLYTAMIW